MQFLKNKNRMPKLKVLNIFLLCVIVGAGVYYLTIINDLTVKGFQLMNLRKNSNNIINENKNIQLKLMSLKSYNNLSKRVKDLSMISVGSEVKYITIMSEVARGN